MTESKTTSEQRRADCHELREFLKAVQAGERPRQFWIDQIAERLNRLEADQYD